MNIKDLLSASVKHNASDLHLSAGMIPMLRIDGEMQQLGNEVLSDESVRRMLNEVMDEEQMQKYGRDLELDFCCELKSIGRFRVNAFMQSRGASGVFRTIADRIPTLAELNAPAIFNQFIEYQKGLVLVTGPTGSGKSTTLAAMIEQINAAQKCHILTIEDPIEFVYQPKLSIVNQREVHVDTHSFSNGLRSALREDLDVILVGELRDKETISLALTAAETGHLVFATLHTSSTAKAIDRIVDVFSAEDKGMVRAMLSESLRAVISQKLLKRRNGGRVAAHEVMVVSSAIRNLIRENKVAQIFSMIQTGASLGMQTFEQSVLNLLEQEIVTQEEADRVLETLQNHHF
ncbi:MAG: type IV pilus twitching motility protein PilT [Enterovibrio sp.]